jgi:hypothetical protein
MEADYSMLIGLISVVGGVGVMGLSYLGAYLLGHSRGRREAELDRQMTEQSSPLGDPQRVDEMKHALLSMSHAIDRLTDAQRIALLDRMRSPAELRSSRVPKHDTPA